MINEVFIVDGVRTAIGSFGGSLSSKTPIELATLITKQLLMNQKLMPKISVVLHLVMCCLNQETCTFQK